MNLREQLLAESRTRWLDIGCGGNAEAGFELMDTHAEGIVDPAVRARYRRVDIRYVSDAQLERLGQFDLVRMQHAFEHFTFEEGLGVLRNCGLLLKPGGYILITAPDLRIHARRYLANEYGQSAGFQSWAQERIPPDAPASCYFSIFTHSMLHEAHHWCYDYEGLRYQLERAGYFGEIRELTLDDPLASTPFTHNRPDEDVCVLARRE
jgi:predicted SAM-dependent methyltransferase